MSLSLNNVTSQFNLLLYRCYHLLFILYINDMQHALGDINVQLYVDDTVLSVSGKKQKKSETYSNAILIDFKCGVIGISLQ